MFYVCRITMRIESYMYYNEDQRTTCIVREVSVLCMPYYNEDRELHVL